MVNSRTKGASAERELSRILGDRLGVNLQRNLDQWRAGGYDLTGLPGIALEVKRHEKLSLPQWWNQARQQAGGKLIPILAYRQSRRPWQFVVPLAWLTGQDFPDTLTATIDLDGFCLLVENTIKGTPWA